MSDPARPDGRADARRELKRRAVVQRLGNRELLEQSVLLRDVHRLPAELRRVSWLPVRKQLAAHVLLS